MSAIVEVDWPARVPRDSYPDAVRWYRCTGCDIAGPTTAADLARVVHTAEDCARRRVMTTCLDAGMRWVGGRLVLYRAAGVPLTPVPGSADARDWFAPAWAHAVATAMTGGARGRAVPYHRRLSLLRRLARDPVAAQLVASHPGSLAALLEARRGA